jgi:electron transfer flavoprotein alpha subunit
MSETGYSVFRTELPAVVTAVKDLSVPRLPTLPGWAGALEEPVRRIGPGDLGLPPGGTGLAGSPTRVKKIRGVVHAKTTEFLDPGSDETVRRVAEILRAAGTRDRSGSRGKDGGDAGLREDDRSDRGAERAPCVLLSPRVSEAEGKPAGKTGVPPERAPIIAVLGEIGRGGLNEVSFELTAAARRLAEERGGRLVFAVAGCCLEKDLADAELPRAEEYIFIETRSKGFEANLYAEAVAAWVREIRPEILLGPGTLKGRSMMPLLAARLETGLTADCTGLEIDPETGLLLQTRPAFGGNVLATIVCESRRPQMATVRPRVFSADSYGRTKVDTLCREGRPPRVFSLDVIAAGTAGSADTGREAEAWSDNGVMDNPGDAGTAGPAGYPRLIAEESLVSEGTDITDASLVVSGGRGLGGPEGFELLHRAAELSGGALGASRSAVEAGWAEYVRQVGQTGKTVQPAVYFAVGISGAVQHVVGMHDSDVVIAVNRDPEAPIFGAADIGIVADYRSFLLKLIKFLEETAV